MFLKTDNENIHGLDELNAKLEAAIEYFEKMFDLLLLVLKR